MFYYVIYNSTVLNYSNNNKNLNTFIYGTILYILSHGLINSYDNQFAHYIKSYFWLILVIDIASIYYMHTYLNQDIESEANNLKSLLDSFNKSIKNDKESDDKDSKDKSKNKEYDNQENKDFLKKLNDEKIIKSKKNNQSDDPLPFQFNENNNISLLENDTDNDNLNNIINNDNDNENDNENDNDISDQISDQMSDEGSDIDLDNFEMSLQD
jgi:hypothetical protein